MNAPGREKGSVSTGLQTGKAFFDGEKEPLTCSTLAERLRMSAFEDRGRVLEAGGKIEDVRRPEETFDVFPADAAQAQVLARAARGDDFVVTGAAGTGKSITIANLMANMVASGKKVLLFAPTDAALQTVEKWLLRAGLSHLAVKPGKHKGNGGSFLSEVETLASLPRPVEIPRAETIHRLKRSQDRMNQYSKVMGSEFRNSGLTPWDIITQFIKLESEKPSQDSNEGEAPAFDCPEIRDWNGTDFNKAVSILAELEQHLSTKGSPVTHLFHGVQITEDELKSAPKLKDTISQTALAAGKSKDAVQKLFSRLGIVDEMTPEQLEKTMEVLELIAEYYTDEGAWFESVSFENSQIEKETQSIRDCIAAGKALGPLKESLLQRVRPEAFEAPNLDRLKEILKLETGDKEKRESYAPEIKLANELLGSICLDGRVPEKTADKLTLVSEIMNVQGLGKRIIAGRDLFENVFGRQWIPDFTENAHFWRRLEFVAESVIKFQKLLKRHPSREALEKLIHEPDQIYACDGDGTLESAVGSFRDFSVKREELKSTLKLREDVYLKQFKNAPLSKQHQLLCDWDKGFESLEELCRYGQKFSAADIPGLESTIRKAEQWNLAGAALVNAVKESWLYGLMNDFLTHCPLARQFEPALQEQYLKELVEADRQFRMGNSSEISIRHWDRLPHLDTGGGQRVLKEMIEFRETSTQTTEEIFEACPEAVLRYTPLVLATPADMKLLETFPKETFDLLICDEASQLDAEAVSLPAEKAKQIIAFGDAQQLASEKGESLLDRLAGAGAAGEELPIHYRSLDGKLLDPVNRALYGNSLQTFPNALRHGSGVKMRREAVAPDSDSLKGISETEADKVIELVKAHAASSPQKSLAILALSREQCEMIHRRIEKEAQTDAVLKAFLTRPSPEPFTVRTVQEIQGDERDSVIASIVYDGSGESGFGPLGVAGGEKMLNVLASRAREDLLFVTSIDPGKMNLKPGRCSEGEKLLRRYLISANNNTSAPNAENTAINDSLLDCIKTSLEKRGYSVATNVGGGDLGVDLAVIDPGNPERFILGILTDGKRAQSIESAVEREIIIPSELRRRGWNIRQTWCMEWLNNAEKTADSFAREIHKLGRQPAKTEGQGSQPAQLFRESALSSAERIKAIVPSYRKAPLVRNSDGSLNLKESLAQIISTEAPVMQNEVIQRLARASGVSSDDQNLQMEAASILNDMTKENRVRISGNFIYGAEEQPVTPRNRSKSDSALRSWNTVCPEEIKAAAALVVENSCGLSPQDVPEETLKLLGLSGPSEGIEAVIAH